MKYNIVICDDEEMILKVNQVYVQEIVKKYNIEVEIQCFLDGNDVLSYASKNQVHIAFLDVEIEQINGLNIAKELKKLNKNIYIIFITGHKEFALSAFDVEALGYLVKPLKPEKLEKQLVKALELIRLQSQLIRNTTLLIVEENVKKKISQFKITYIEKEKNQCVIHTIDSTHYTYISIGKILDKLESYFWQANQGIIVNSKYIKKIDKNDLILKNGVQVTMGRKFIKSIKEHFYETTK